MNGRLEVTDDVPGRFAEVVVEAFRNRPEDLFSFALSGGDTARACYERLAADAAEKIDWWKVDFYWGDERCVPPDHADSNEWMARQALLERVGAANSVRPMRCEEGPDAYQLLVGRLGQFDLVHLGLGPDGHTASLFPDSEALGADAGQLVAMNVDPHGRNPHPRMTLTLEGISRSRLVVFSVVGPQKADAMRAVYEGAQLPGGMVSAERVLWLVDPAASPL